MTTLGRVRGWQGRLYSSHNKMVEAREQTYVRVVRAFNLEASNAGLSKEAIALGIHGIEQAILAGLSYEAVRSIGWALAQGKIEEAEEIIKTTVPEFDPETGDPDVNGDDAKDAAKEAAELADKTADTQAASSAPENSKKPAKSAASKSPKTDKKTDKTTDKKAEKKAAKDVAEPAQELVKEPVPAVSPEAAEYDPTMDEQFGFEA